MNERKLITMIETKLKEKSILNALVLMALLCASLFFLYQLGYGVGKFIFNITH